MSKSDHPTFVRFSTTHTPSGKIVRQPEASVVPRPVLDCRRTCAHTVFLLCTWASLSWVPLAQAQPMLFAETPWGAAAGTVKTQFEQHGFVYQGTNRDGDLVFRGRAFDTPTTVVAVLSKGGLARVDVALATEARGAFETYARVRGVLIARYGKPAKDYVLFEPPYRRGDGREAQAIRSGRGHVLAAWRQDDNTAMLVRVTERLTVRVSYESPGSQDEQDTAQAGGASAF